jgi:hypothetical protein
MAKKPNDRISDSAPQGDLPDPKVFFVVDGKKFSRPSLETYYAKADDKQLDQQTSVCSCNTVTGTYCSCNKVCTCNLVCTCQAMCSCQSVCSCVGYTTSSGGTSCSCNKVCSCVPVH